MEEAVAQTSSVEAITRKKLTLTDLSKLMPHLFAAKPMRPLKVGIFDDILAVVVKDQPIAHTNAIRNNLRSLLSIHAGRIPYIRALAAGGPRYDIEGNPCGEVSPEDVERAKQKLGTSADTNFDYVSIFGRKKLLDKLSESGLTAEAFAAQEGRNVADFKAVIAKAQAERDDRRNKRRALASEFASSGKSEQEFAKSKSMSTRALMKAIDKAATYAN